MSTIRVLIFRVGGESFALPLADVLEVEDHPSVMTMPLSPPGVLGQTSHRGRLVTVIDAGFILGVPYSASDGTMLVLDDSEERFGLLVDDVSDMVELEETALMAVPTVPAAGHVTLLAIAQLGSGIAGLVDVETVRAAARMRHVTEVG